MIEYSIVSELDPEEFIEVLRNSTLGERRPIDQPDTIRKMLKNANLIVVARENGKLIGVARSLSDFAFCTYLSDLAVDQDYQKRGIGKELIKETMKQAPGAKLILLSAPAAVDYYPRIGMKKFDYCFVSDDFEAIK
jgi:predicted N-acetyltransferase YhbS